MKTFRRISLTSVTFALVILALHAFVPHHHRPLGTDVICTTQNHHVANQWTTQECCFNDAHDCQSDVVCGLSHIFIASSEHLETAPFCIKCQSVIPEPNIIKIDSHFVAFDSHVIQEFISHSVPLRAPPVV